jgi:hypothetical protein
VQPDNAEALLGALTTDRARTFDLDKQDRHAASSWHSPGRRLTRLRASRFPPDSWRPTRRTLEVSLLGRIGDATYYGGDIAGALAPYREAEGPDPRRTGEGAFGAPGRSGWARRATTSASTLADMGGHNAEALAEVDRGVTEMERARSFGPDAAIEMRLIILLGQKSLILSAMGREREAAEVSIRKTSISEARLAAAPGDVTRRRDLVVGLAAHADLLAKAGDRTAACRAARRGAELLGELRGSGDLSERDVRTEIPKLAAAAERHCN